jgi:release factor glutamine methyltransferase
LHKHGVEKQVKLVQGNLLDPVNTPVDIIAANLPYIDKETYCRLPPEIRLFEPASALSGGDDGLSYIRSLLQQAGNSLNKGGCILLEIGYGQKSEMLRLASQYFPQSRVAFYRDPEHRWVVHIY